jgi:hypothetical protein
LAPAISSGGDKRNPQGVKRVRHKLLTFVYGARKRVKKVSII